jgi:peptidyl-prolyl cis-trans isomerase SurA
MKINRFLSALLVVLTILTQTINGQSYILDEVVAVVGNKAIKQSDIETEYNELKRSNYPIDENTKCLIFENILKQKMLYNQALLDSLVVSEAQIDAELTQNLNKNIAIIGSVEKLEKYFNKSIQEIKEDLRTSMKEMRLAGQMQEKAIENIAITPSEVKKFYKSLAKDSIPFINAQIELAQIAVYPPYTQQAILDVKDQLLEYRKRILNGEKFEVIARLYSEDPGTASKGGEYGLSTKGELDPDFGKAAFALKKPGEISRIVESQFGFHLIQLIDRKGDRVNFRHILVKPKVDPEVAIKVKTSLDSIGNLIRKDSMTFEKAVLYFSMDMDTRYNKGLMVNANTGNNKFELEQLAQADYYYVKKMKPGDISEPYESRDSKGKILYKIITIKNQIPAHRANLDEDYNLLEQMALNKKRMDVLEDWFINKKKNTFIHISDTYKTCDFIVNGWFKTK